MEESIHDILQNIARSKQDHVSVPVAGQLGWRRWRLSAGIVEQLSRVVPPRSRMRLRMEVVLSPEEMGTVADKTRDAMNGYLEHDGDRVGRITQIDASYDRFTPHVAFRIDVYSGWSPATALLSLEQALGMTLDTKITSLDLTIENENLGSISRIPF